MFSFMCVMRIYIYIYEGKRCKKSGERDPEKWWEMYVMEGKGGATWGKEWAQQERAELQKQIMDK